MKRFLIIVLVIAAAWFVLSEAEPQQASIDQGMGKVVVENDAVTGEMHRVIRVVDGDTIVVDIDERETTVRLIGIDTPEVDGPHTDQECFGSEASEKMKDFVEGKYVHVQADSSQAQVDVYGRLLAYVFLDDETNVIQEMIHQGYGYEYTYKGSPYQYQKEFVEAERLAQLEQKGLWNECY